MHLPKPQLKILVGSLIFISLWSTAVTFATTYVAPGYTLDPLGGPGSYTVTPPISYGNSVTTGHNGEVLYTDSSGNLASDGTFTRNQTTHDLLISNVDGVISDNIEQNDDVNGYGLKGTAMYRRDSNTAISAGFFAGDATSIGLNSMTSYMASGGSSLVAVTPTRIQIGDVLDQGNSTTLVVKDATQEIKFNYGPSNSYTFPIGHGTAGQVLTDVSGNGALAWQTPTGGGGGSVAGSDTQVQYNNLGSFGATSNFAFDSSISRLSIYNPSNGDGKVRTGILNLTVGAGSKNVNITPSVSQLADYTLTLPAAQGGVDTYLKNDGSGGLSWATPSGNISGSGAANQVSFWDGTNSLSGTNGFTWNNASNILSVTDSIGKTQFRIGTGNHQYIFGDFDVSNNGTYFQVLDNANRYEFSKPTFQIGNVTYVFPNAQGGVGETFVNDGSGNLSWAAIGTAANPAGSNTQIQFNDSGIFGATSNFVWDNASLRLGIRNSNPSYSLDVHGDAASPYVGYFDSEWLSTRLAINNDSGNTGFGLMISDSLKWSNSVAQYNAGNYEYAIYNDQIGNKGLAIDGDTNYMILNAANGTLPDYQLDVRYGGSGVVAQFKDSIASCTINPTAATFSCSSDQRLKKNILGMDSNQILDKVLSLRGVTYQWNKQTDDASHTGFIAQELEQVFPEFVQTDASGYKSVGYGSLTPVLVEAIKALNLKIEKISLPTNDSNFFSKLREFFADTTNGITDLFAGRVHTHELCLDEICVTKVQLQTLLQNQSSSNYSLQSTGNNTTTGDSNSNSTTTTSGDVNTTDNGTVDTVGDTSTGVTNTTSTTTSGDSGVDQNVQLNQGDSSGTGGGI